METVRAPVQVFVDGTGRRRRWLRAAAVLTALLCMSYVAMIGLSVFGASHVELVHAAYVTASSTSKAASATASATASTA